MISRSIRRAKTIAPKISPAVSVKSISTLKPSNHFGMPSLSTFSRIYLASNQTPRRPFSSHSDPSRLPHAQSKLIFDLKAEDISGYVSKIIADSKSVQDAVAALPAENRSFATVVKPLADTECVFSTLSSNVTFPSYVSTDKPIRDASTEANKAIQDFEIESSMREDVYLALKTVKDKEYESLDTDQKRLLDHMIRDFERNGLHLPQEKRDRAKEIKKRISEQCIEFERNVAEDKTECHFTREELEGLPDDFLEGLNKTAEGKYIVTMKYPDLLPVMRMAQVESTRKTLEHTNSARLVGVNDKIMEEVIRLRHDFAELLGHPTHAAYRLEIRMAKTAEAVLSFLRTLSDRLQEPCEAEMKVLLELKKQEKESRGEEFDGKINAWDFQYYNRKLLEDKYKVNDQEIKNYFPLDKAVAGMFSTYQELLGVRFEEEKEDTKKIWHPDVKSFLVYDKESGDFLGQFYMDMHPRDGKYTHAAAFPLQPSHFNTDGTTRQFPVSAMVCNFTKPTATAPSLLLHNEVVTLYHEFGHIMHGVCTKAKYARFSGTSVETDFVEAPSQMMENWCWERESLLRVSSHYKDGSALPAEVLENMLAAKNVNAGLMNRRQIFFGMFDMTIHTQRDVSTGDVWGSLRKPITMIEHTAGTNPAATFGHMMGGYDAGYYGYLWSEVFSADMFEQFLEKGIFNGTLGKEYRQKVLEMGGMKDGSDIIRSFLGREVNQDAFLRSLGVYKTPSERR